MLGRERRNWMGGIKTISLYLTFGFGYSMILVPWAKCQRLWTLCEAFLCTCFSQTFLARSCIKEFSAFCHIYLMVASLTPSNKPFQTLSHTSAILERSQVSQKFEISLSRKYSKEASLFNQLLPSHSHTYLNTHTHTHTHTNIFHTTLKENNKFPLFVEF
jgi:hypothetical protein